MAKRDANLIWEEQARVDLSTSAHAVERVRYSARDSFGRLLLGVCGSSIFTYSVADAPKVAWLKRALAGSGPHLLDVGVRTGAGASFFRNLGKKVFGIDIAQQYIDHCMASGVIVGGTVCDLEKDALPTPADLSAGLPGAYDVIYFSEVIELLLDGKAVLQKLSSALRPGGFLIVTTPNLAYLVNRIRLLAGRDLDTLTMDRGEVGNQHIRVFTARLLKRLCHEVGLEVDMIGSEGLLVSLERWITVTAEDGDTLPEDDYPPMVSIPGSGRFTPTLGRSIYVRARKV